ncbi:MAG: TolC family protein [Crocinitomicaceae bacterium]
MNYLFMILMWHLAPFNAAAQNEWSLQKCVDSALVNNSNIRLADRDIQISAAVLKGDKYNFLPSLNANTSYGYNWGQTIDPFTNEFASNRTQYTNFYLSSSVALFSGLSNIYQKKISSVGVQIASAQSDLRKRNLTVDVLSIYLQVKLNQSLIDMRKKHLLFMQEDLKKASMLEELGYDVEAKRLEKEARYMQEKHQLVLAKNDYKSAIFLLQVTLGKAPDTLFTISDSIILQKINTIDDNAIETLQIERNLFTTKLLKAQFFPTISINGALGSGYSENSTQLLGGVLTPIPFREQLDNNLYRSVSATLSVPIFNGTKSYARIKVNELEQEQRKIELEQKSLDVLNKQMELRLKIDNEKLALEAAHKTLSAYEKLYSDSQVKYESETIDYFTYLQHKDAYLTAESEMIQARFKLIFAELVLLLFQ